MGDVNLLANTKEMLKFLLKANSGYHTIESLNNDFMDYFGAPIPYYELGYRFLETFFQSIPDILQVNYVTKAVCISYNAENTSQSFGSVLSISSMRKQLSGLSPDYELLSSPLPISKSSDQHPTNLAVLDLHKHADIDNEEQSFSIEYATEKSSLDKDFKASVRLNSSNCDLNSWNVEREGAKNLIHDSISCLNELSSKCELNRPTFSNNEAINDSIQLNKYGVKLECANIESKMAIGESYELRISEVNSPYKFWFQFEDDFSQLDNLHNQLNKCETNSQHIIEKRHMVKGHLCAAIFDLQWHRAEFIDRPEGENVKVFFVDFGTVSKVRLTDVRYLMDCFCKLPKLCFRGTLDFIKPTEYRWNREATTYLIDLVSNVKLVAGVSEINSKDNSARIYLMDESKNININYMMVVQSHALPDNPTERYKIHIADAFPTFELLENGKYPSFDEVGECLKEGIDLEKMFESNFIENFNYFTPKCMSDLDSTEIIQKYYREKKQAIEIASKKDATIFMHLFGHMWNNPFLNGMVKRIPDNKISKVSSRNPFLEG